MKTLKCDQCPKTFTKRTMKECEASMRMHVGRKHGNIKTPTGPMKPRQKPAPEAAPKRAYMKPKSETHEVHLNFCPDCGCDLHTVALGIAMAKKLKN